MNSMFGGQISEQILSKELHRLVTLSRKYISKPASEKIIHKLQGEMWVGIVRGKNQGIGVHHDKEVSIFFDGDLYNPDVFGLDWKQVKTKNIRDQWCEALAKYYRKRGTQLFGKIDGMFAIVIYDHKKKKLLLARDSKGYRMLYFAKGKDGLVWGSRLASVAALRQMKLERNKVAEPFQFVYGFSPQNKTVVKGINKILPGTFLEWKIDKGVGIEKAFQFRTNWKFVKQAADPRITAEKAKKLLYESFMESLDRTSYFGKKVGVLLGGLDSAAVAAGLKRLGRDVETYSFRWSDDRFNQKNIGVFQKHVGIKHFWFDLSRKFIEDRLQQIPEYVDEPRMELLYMISTTEIAGFAAKRGCDIIATGDEAEDVLGGYPALHGRVTLINKTKHAPRWLRYGLIKLLEQPLVLRKSGHPVRNILTILKKANYNDQLSYFLLFRLFDEQEMPRLLGNQARSQIRKHDTVIQSLSKHHRSLPGVFVAHRGHEIASSIRFKHAGPSTVYDVAMMSPFLHKGFVQTCEAINREVMYPHGFEKSDKAKFLFREMVKEYDLLPEIVSDQKKDTPGNTPVDYWLETDFQPKAWEIMETLPDDFSRRYMRELFDKKYFQEIYRKAFGVNSQTSHSIQALLGYALFWNYIKEVSAYE